MSVVALRERAQHVQAVIRDLMVEGVHYMAIPGTSGMSLTKQGSEMLLSAFHISIEPHIEDRSDADAARTTVRVIGTHMGSGVVVGVGVGRCSSNEEKYKWRAAVCKEEWDATPEARRRVTWKYGKGSSVYSVNQVRSNPEDQANTVLKMAKKRAQVDLCLTALAASDAFKRQPAPPKGPPPPTVDKGPASAAPGASPAAETKRPDPETKAPASATVGPPGETNRPRPATSAQLGLIRQKLDAAGIGETHFLAQFELGDFKDLTFDKVTEGLRWITQLAEGPPE